MAQINPKITIRSVYFGMLLLSAAVMILTVRLTVASELDSLKAAGRCRKPYRGRHGRAQGDAKAQYSLGYMYDFGEGVPQNDAEAVRWYRMAAEQGHAKALFNLGFMHFNNVAKASPKTILRRRDAVSHGRRPPSRDMPRRSSMAGLHV